MAAAHDMSMANNMANNKASRFWREARQLSVDSAGNLMIRTSLGSITDARPVTYCIN
jgi:hypothetical protein